MQKKVIQGTSSSTTDYLNGFQYVDNVLSFIPTAEGFFDFKTNRYVYQYVDQLGNVRLSYSDKDGNNKIETAEIIEQINYYPFGLAHKGYNQKNDPLMKDFKYQYKGKENQEELGLNVYDYGARNYDAAIGRWMNVDPLAEKMPGWNPYTYTFNNPIMFTDPTGMEPEGKEDWIEYKGLSGNTQYIYDRDVKNKEDAAAKGYQNVKNVSAEMTVESENVSYQLSDNATVTNSTKGIDVKPGFMTAEGSYIGENNMSKSTARGLQNGGDVMVYGGIALTISGGGVLGSSMATMGSILSGTGTVLELITDGIENKFSIEKFVTKAMFFFIGNKVGRLGKNQSENMMNTGVMNVFEKTVDDARDNQKGPYKK